MFTGVLPLVSKESAIVGYIGCFLSLGSVVYLREILPFREPFTNNIAIVANYVILSVFIAASMIETETLSEIYVSDFGLGCFLVAVNILLLLMILYGGLLRYFEKIRNVKEKTKNRIHIEWGVTLSKTKFDRTLSALTKRIPTSHLVVYYYTSLSEAEAIVQHNGVPALKLNPALTALTMHRSHIIGGGVVVSLKPPHHIKSNDLSLAFMNPLASTKEAVICLVLPRSLLWPLELTGGGGGGRVQSIEEGSSGIDSSLDSSFDSSIDVRHLRVLPVEVIEAMSKCSDEYLDSVLVEEDDDRSSPSNDNEEEDSQSPSPSNRSRISSQHTNLINELEKLESNCEDLDQSEADLNEPITRHHLQIQKLNMLRVLKIYQLKVDSELSNRKFEVEDLQMIGCDETRSIINKDLNMNRPTHVYRPLDFKHYLKKINIAREACYSLNLVPLYCYTSSFLYGEMVTQGIKLSPIDQKTPGVFFSMKGPCSLGFGTKSFAELSTVSFEDQVIEHIYGREFVKEYSGKGLVDMVIVYGAEPCCVEKSPRMNRVFYGQHNFEQFASQNAIQKQRKHDKKLEKRTQSTNIRMSASSFAKRISVKTPHIYNSFYLRPDRILSSFHLPENIKLKKQDDKYLVREIKRDERVALILSKVQQETEHNLLSNIQEHTRSNPNSVRPSNPRDYRNPLNHGSNHSPTPSQISIFSLRSSFASTANNNNEQNELSLQEEEDDDDDDDDWEVRRKKRDEWERLASLKYAPTKKSIESIEMV